MGKYRLGKWQIALATTTLVLLSGSPVRAQVINGESTYEDNYEHVPPADPPKADQNGKAVPAGADNAAPPRERRQDH